MTTRRARREDRERRQAMAAKYPACRWCKKPVVAGQRDPWGQPAHLMCAMAFDLLAADHPARRWTGAPQQTSTGTVPVGKGTP